jgi:hypothetical protein
MTENKTKHRRTGALLAGALGVVALSLTAATTLGGFTASVASSNTGTTGTIVLQLSKGAVNCDSTNGTGAGGTTDTNTGTSCAANIDALAASNMLPGGATTATTVTLKNLGVSPASTLNMVAGTCTGAQRTDTGNYFGTGTALVCGKVNFTLQDGTNCVVPAHTGACVAADLTSAHNLTNMGTVTLNGATALAAGATDTLVLTTQLDSTAGNNVQGLKATLPITWNLIQ